ncbi:MAG: c-type cytochrome [Deltaproteobacteria bacterium]|nr:c-type cytochrome [Deltaproteobacteria bacterium]MBW2695010.1 c-type cytochrome [Deltaproteobacteria bacterium]
MLALTAAMMIGCDSYSEVRAGLDAAGRERFTRGQRAATPCWTCHDVTGTSIKIGPGLQNLIGRRAGAEPGFPHSAAMRSSGITWNERTLDAFLSDGQGFIPGNKMIGSGVPDPRLRMDLIFFLRLVTPAADE